MVPPNHIELLFQGAQKGDREAFDRFIEDFRGRLDAWVESQIGQKLKKYVDAQDVRQETFLQAFRSLGSIQWKGEAAFFGWLKKVAGNIIRGEARRFLRLEQVDLDPEQPGSQVPPMKAERRNERFDRLQRAFESLPHDYYHVLFLARIKGLKIKDIAQQTNRSEGAVMQLLARALKKLRTAFGEDTESLHLPPRSLEERGEPPEDQRGDQRGE